MKLWGAIAYTWSWIVSLGGIFAQQVGTGSDTATAAGIAGLLVQLGLSGVFFWQWRDERNQRIKREDQMLEFLERLAPLLAESTDTLKEVNRAQSAIVSQIPSSDRWERAIHELERTTDTLLHEIRPRER